MSRVPSQTEIDKITNVEVRNINDIKKAIKPFLKEVSDKKIDISADVSWIDDGGKKQVTKVDAYSSDPSMRRGLIDGFNQVKEHEKMWDNLHDALEEDEYGAILPTVDIDKMHLPIDRLIQKRLGGRREGMTIVWDMPDSKVVFDPFEKTLEEIKHG